MTARELARKKERERQIVRESEQEIKCNTSITICKSADPDL